MRIHIIGGSGSGKTYAAERLSAILGVPHYDLDDVFWASDDVLYEKRNPPEVRERLLADIISGDNWIVEGAYYAWVAASFERADRIFVLRPNIWLRNWRVFRRYAGRRLGLLQDTARRETFRSTLGLMSWNVKYDHDNLPKALAMLQQWADKVVVVRDGSELLSRTDSLMARP